MPQKHSLFLCFAETSQVLQLEQDILPPKEKKIQVLRPALNNEDAFMLFNKHYFANLFKKKNEISDD